MRHKLKTCCNGDGRPIQPPSEVLCKECLDELDRKFQALAASLGAAPKPEGK